MKSTAKVAAKSTTKKPVAKPAFVSFKDVAATKKPAAKKGKC